MKTKIFTMLMLAGISAPAGAVTTEFSKIFQSPELQKALGNGAESITIHAALPGSGESRFVVSAQYPGSSCAFDVTSDRGQVSVRSMGCEDDIIRVTDLTTAPTFTKDIQPLFKSRCVMCHGPGKVRPSDYTDYNTVVSMKDVLVQRVLVKKDMPMGVKLDPASLSLIDAWVKAGQPQ